MKAQFSSPVTLGCFTFGTGQQIVPDELARGPLWDGLIRDGVVKVLRQPKPQPFTPEPEVKTETKKGKK